MTPDEERRKLQKRLEEIDEELKRQFGGKMPSKIMMAHTLEQYEALERDTKSGRAFKGTHWKVRKPKDRVIKAAVALFLAVIILGVWKLLTWIN